MLKSLPIRHSSCSCAYVVKTAHSLGTHSPSYSMGQSPLPLTSALRPLQAAHIAHRLCSYTAVHTYILPHRYCVPARLSHGVPVPKYTLHVNVTHGGVSHPMPQLHPNDTQQHRHKHHATAASVSASAPLPVCWGLLYAACERPPAESTLEGCLL